ncbi:MAG: IS1595 family transposase [Candidatus Competibacteraceae bacterium]|nr:IS1595 family transposase [Candidatus Competibacteraceae bacterium]
MGSMEGRRKEEPQLARSPIVAMLPKACSDETAAVEFMEARRWGDHPACPHYGSTTVYKMTSASGGRNKRFLWRCRDCEKQYTVRIGTIMEDSRIPTRHWCYAFWAACSSKKGVSSLQIMRMTGVTYKSALFMMHRIRWAMADSPMLAGDVEADETWVGGAPRNKGPHNKRGRGTKKQPVAVLVERDGNARAVVVEKVDAKTLRQFISETVEPGSRIMTDENAAYPPATEGYRHESVNHSAKQWVGPGNVHSNTAESFFALVKRGVYGTFHAVSRKHLHRYISEFQFRWNARKINDGDRVERAIQSAVGETAGVRKCQIITRLHAEQEHTTHEGQQGKKRRILHATH